MGSKTRIDWCDATWNPVTGCLHGCEYCYARGIATRFSGHLIELDGYMETIDSPLTLKQTKLHVLKEPQRDGKGKIMPYPYGFDPTFHMYREDIPAKWNKPQTIFVCSMADLFGEWVPESWIQAVFKACEAAPQHTYLFLTKNPKRLQDMYNARLVREWNKEHPDKPHPQTADYEKVTPLPKHENWWWGSTITSRKSMFFQGGLSDNVFLSIEPIQEHLDSGLGSFGDAKWIIVGAETGNRKGKIVPEKAWIDNITDTAGITQAAVFMKDSLKEIMGKDFRQEFPWDD